MHTVIGSLIIFALAIIAMSGVYSAWHHHWRSLGRQLGQLGDIRHDPLLNSFDQGTTTADPSFCFMTMILKTAVCVAAIMWFMDTAPAVAKKARVVCEYGRCWQADAGFDYQYGYRPPTKWEQKGFCPPGQAKKGNC